MRPVTDLMWKALVDTADALRGWYSGLSIDPTAWGPFTWLIIAGVVLILLTLLVRPRRAWKRRPELLISHGEVVMRDPASLPAVSLARSAPPHVPFELRMTVSNLGARPVQILELSIRTNRSSVPNTAEVGALVPPHGAVDVAAEVHEMEGDEGTIDLYVYAPDMRPKTFRLRARLRWEPWNVRFKLMPLQQRVEKTRDLASLRQNRREERRWRRRLAESGGGGMDDVPIPLPVEQEEGRGNLTWEPAPQFVPSQETVRPRGFTSAEPSTTDRVHVGPTAHQRERADAGGADAGRPEVARTDGERAVRERADAGRAVPGRTDTGRAAHGRDGPGVGRPVDHGVGRSEHNAAEASAPEGGDPAVSWQQRSPQPLREPELEPLREPEPKPEPKPEPRPKPEPKPEPKPKPKPEPEPLREPSGEAEGLADAARADRPVPTLGTARAESVSRPADPVQGSPRRPLVPPPSDESQAEEGKGRRVERSRVELPAEPMGSSEAGSHGARPQGSPGSTAGVHGAPVQETGVDETQRHGAQVSGTGIGEASPPGEASHRAGEPKTEPRSDQPVSPRTAEPAHRDVPAERPAEPGRPPSEGRTGAQLGQWRPDELVERDRPRNVRPTAGLGALGEAARRLVRGTRNDRNPSGPSGEPDGAAEHTTDPHRSTWESAWAPQTRDRGSERRVGVEALGSDVPSRARGAGQRHGEPADRDGVPGPERQGLEHQDPKHQDPKRQDPKRRDPERQNPELQDPARQGPASHDAAQSKNDPQVDERDDDRAGHRPPLEFPDDFT